MSKITVVNNITLDGVMQAPACPDEDPRGGFTHGGWGIPYQDSVIAQKMGATYVASRTLKEPFPATYQAV
jgi:hypothetical protein